MKTLLIALLLVSTGAIAGIGDPLSEMGNFGGMFGQDQQRNEESEYRRQQQEAQERQHREHMQQLERERMYPGGSIQQYGNQPLYP